MSWKTFLAACLLAGSAFAAHFTMEQVMSAPFPSELTVSRNSGKIAWVLDENGARNIWIAEAPDYKGRRLTKYTADDGQEIAQMSWTPDGRSIIYVRGGDFEMHRDNPNPASLPEGVEQDIWIAPLNGEPARKISEGNGPAISPKGDRIVFLKNNQVWSAALAPGAKPAQLIHAKGRISMMRWTPDGSRIVFINNRTEHSIVGAYDFGAKKLWYIDPSTDVDSSPALSADGKQVAYIRIASTSNGFRFGPERSAETPWSIHIADVGSGTGHELWHASKGPGSAFHPMIADNQLLWGAGDRIVFPWEKTGYVHLYSISTHGDNPTPLNSGGAFEIEDASLTADGRDVLFNSNQNDIDRRQLWRVPITGGTAAELTKSGLNWMPAQTGDGKAIAFFTSDERRPARAAVLTDRIHDLAPDSIPADFPVNDLVAPQPVIISAADGMQIHCQLFLPPDSRPGEKHPAAVFFHGGSRRQMLLGWHYMDYYNNAYAMNQYLANHGYVVLAVNYRSGIGYGLNFREALNYGAAGASEFNDVMGAGLYLRSRPDVDGHKIASWGGSYGGYLTALALSRASDLFAAGVDFHGVHNWNTVTRNFDPTYDPSKDESAARLAFESSPMASVSTWRSPVLLIHGDDDRNVPFTETVGLVEALRKQGVEFQELIFPDEIHGFLTHKRWVQAYEASAKFLDQHLK